MGLGGREGTLGSHVGFRSDLEGNECCCYGSWVGNRQDMSSRDEGGREGKVGEARSSGGVGRWEGMETSLWEKA